METRKLNISFNRSGGTASKGGITTRITLPKKWIDKMNLKKDDREVLVSFDGERIIIEKMDLDVKE
jgi:bifunctional DNA-binding transcriptional regulator/antitoxin component of YhaV-PrlF toxin-antitoxin module